MQSAKDAREARRRKILERGSDRLAFISGQHKLIPSPPPPPPPSQPVNGGFSTEIQEEPSVDVSGMNGNLSESLQDNSKTTSSVENFGGKRQSSAVPASDFSCSGNQSRHKKKLFISSFFTVKRFSCAINASENARVICAVGVAILVVIHNFLAINNPLGAVLDDFFPSWPFSLIILTSITLVMATMLVSSRNTNVIDDVIDQTPDETHPTSGVWQLANIIGNVLETFFILRKVGSAMLIDFSIYFVVLVCGLSIDHYWS